MPATHRRAPSARAQRLADRYGTTYAEQAQITLRDKPAPLWQLLVLSLLLSARIDSGIAVASAHELFRAGWRTPQRMRDSGWQQRVDALGRGGYRRYDERTATQLEAAAVLVLERWHGDLRRLYADAGAEVAAIRERLQEVNGIGPVGSAIFVREVQAVWPGVRPFVDDLTASGARRLGLPLGARELARQVPADDFARLVAACVRAALDPDAAEAMVQAV